jgi:hypothetical protein
MDIYYCGPRRIQRQYNFIGIFAERCFNPPHRAGTLLAIISLSTSKTWSTAVVIGVAQQFPIGRDPLAKSGGAAVTKFSFDETSCGILVEASCAVEIRFVFAMGRAARGGRA